MQLYLEAVNDRESIEKCLMGVKEVSGGATILGIPI